MKLRHKRALAATAALALTAPALLALNIGSASATPPTGSGALQCANSLVGQIAPFIWSVTATPTATVAPGGTVAVNNAVVTLTVPGPVVGGFAAQAGATSVGLNATTLKLDATNASGSLSATVTSPAQAITGYSPTGGPGGTPIANDITFTVSSVNFGSVTATGAHGSAVAVSLAANASADVIALQAGLGLSFINCFNETPSAPNPAPGPTGAWQPTGVPFDPSIGSTNIVDPTPTVTVSGSYGAVAGISNALPVGVTSNGGSAPVGSSWAIASGPTCTGAGGNGTASISGNAAGATVTFDAPNNTATCTIGVTVADANTTSTVAVLNINVAAGDSLQQDVTQEVNPGVLDLLACGDTSPDPTACGAEMSAITLNGSNQTTTGAIEQVTVLDARGGPIAWSLTAQLDGDLTNGNASLTGPNAVIDDALLKITPSCATAPGSSNTQPTAGAAAQSLNAPAAICSATAGQNTGSFLVDGGLSLSVPSTAYAGTYTGTINFIVS